MLKILFIGDINGKIGREAVKKILPKLKKEHKIDLVIANAENIAHGKGLTEPTLKEMLDAGVDWFTSGDHAFDNIKHLDLFDKEFPLLRPANFPPTAPGKGYSLIGLEKHKILLINVIGRVFMAFDYDCPFRKIEEILAIEGLSLKNVSAILVDIHAEATSEKVALGHYLDGRVSAVLGTHTHVMTADEKISSKGTAYLTDVGMVGASDGVIGVDKENIIKIFLTQIKQPHVIPESGPAIFNAVLTNIDEKTGRATSIKKVIKYLNIN
jgi:hypothetical protein